MTSGAFTALRGAIGYEFRMQARRKAVWITVGLLSVFPFVASGLRFTVDLSSGAPLPQAVAGWALQCMLFGPLGFGIMLADRLRREHRLGATELFDTLPVSMDGRLWGKYLGAALATMAPLFLVYAAGAGYIAIRYNDWRAIPLAVAVFLLVNIPGLAFVGAFSIACPAVLWTPLYWVLFTGYWMWGNNLDPETGIPTLSGTWLEAAGSATANGFFNAPSLNGTTVAPWEGVLSIALLLGGALVAMLACRFYLKAVAQRY